VTSKEKTFPCSGCGGCCMVAASVGLPDRGDGACIHLDKENKCSIYEDRPLICRVDELFEEIDHGMTKEEWYDANKKSCNSLIDKLNLDKKYKLE